MYLEKLVRDVSTQMVGSILVEVLLQDVVKLGLGGW